ncbi:Hypothetical protein NTJ_00311 [Nesidiocoris tenuis]|uniref:Uncharacterized protein n=1 Tax=Nesidiocoris tenuis TaxID=355587 RepID=A0ABN7A5M2_9HEMI|nr:Hypothetical protein NTJ_00311 [Nesidiocoris tenuis]
MTTVNGTFECGGESYVRVRTFPPILNGQQVSVAPVSGLGSVCVVGNGTVALNRSRWESLPVRARGTSVREMRSSISNVRARLASRYDSIPPPTGASAGSVLLYSWTTEGLPFLSVDLYGFC